MRAICTYTECTKTTTNDWDIRPLVTIKVLLADISWIARQICTIELALECAHQSISYDMVYSKVISIHRDISI